FLSLQAGKEARPGDLIEIFRSTYSHCTSEMEMLFTLEQLVSAHSGFSNVTGDGIVKKGKLQEVAENNRWRVNNSLDKKYKPLSLNTIVKKACSRVGASLKYNLKEYNCEHFATEMRYGKAESRQVGQHYWCFRCELH
uniref:LRAT domain-containing protein n=1 Tax=Oryzias melastigma TaxID=30732 RepID=A0A3B3DIA8_ORYME